MNTQKSVLILEDDEDTGFLMKKALKLEGFRAALVASASDALEALDTENPDVILLDLSMPDMDGAEFMRALKQHPTASAVKVIVVSGWDNLAAKAREVGADGYVRKPVDITLLLNEIGRLS